jgi:hypothetical protein
LTERERSAYWTYKGETRLADDPKHAIIRAKGVVPLVCHRIRLRRDHPNWLTLVSLTRALCNSNPIIVIFNSKTGIFHG